MLQQSQEYEKAPGVEDRIEAAKKISDGGYETRIRIDPMVPVFEWEKQYVELIDKIFAYNNIHQSMIVIDR